MYTLPANIMLFYIRDSSIPEYRYPPEVLGPILWGYSRATCGNDHDILEGFLMARHNDNICLYLSLSTYQTEAILIMFFFSNFNFNLKIYPNDSFKWNKEEHSKM